MAKTFQYTRTRRFVDKLMRNLLRLGIAPKHYYLLTVPGRKSGRLYSLPVALIEEEEQRWLVAPYGSVNWVHNARAAGQVALSRGEQSETVRVAELGAEESASILQKYLARYAAFAQPYFDTTPDAPLETFIEEAVHHPVFLIQAIS